MTCARQGPTCLPPPWIQAARSTSRHPASQTQPSPTSSTPTSSGTARWASSSMTKAAHRYSVPTGRLSSCHSTTAPTDRSPSLAFSQRSTGSKIAPRQPASSVKPKMNPFSRSSASSTTTPTIFLTSPSLAFHSRSRRARRAFRSTTHRSSRRSFARSPMSRSSSLKTRSSRQSPSLRTTQHYPMKPEPPLSTSSQETLKTSQPSPQPGTLGNINGFLFRLAAQKSRRSAQAPPPQPQLQQPPAGY